jgi:hypothetical protein
MSKTTQKLPDMLNDETQWAEISDAVRGGQKETWWVMIGVGVGIAGIILYLLLTT